MKLIEHTLWVGNAPYHKTNIMLRIRLICNMLGVFDAMNSNGVIRIQHFKIWILGSTHYYQGKVNEAS